MAEVTAQDILNPAPADVLDICKMVFVGDQHVADNPPASRCDDYRAAIFAKLTFILDYALSKRIRYVVLLGDLFHRKRPSLNSHDLVSSLVRLFLSFKERFLAAHGVAARIFSAVGNHDIYHALDNLAKQPIQVLAEAGALELLTGKPFQLEADVELNGVPYSEETETEPSAYHLPFLSETSFKVWCFHSTLLPDGEQFFGTWVNFHQVADIKADLVVAGHYHPGFPLQQAHGKYWLNPGSISRGTADEHNFTREIKVVSFLRRRDGKLTFKDIPVPHQPADKVFRVEAATTNRDREANIAAFASALRDKTATIDDTTSTEKLRAALEVLSDDREAIDTAWKYLEEASEDVGR